MQTDRVACDFNLSIGEAETGGLPWVLCQFELQNEIMSQKQKNKPLKMGVEWGSGWKVDCVCILFTVALSHLNEVWPDSVMTYSGV